MVMCQIILYADKYMQFSLLRLRCHLKDTIYCLSYAVGDVTIPGSVQLTVDSDLNGESPQFTLTCISIGGPATTVIWTRDTQRVFESVTVLDKAVTAQYTHTLNVTGIYPGHYQCTVSNNKPSTAARNFTVQGDSRTKHCILIVSYHICTCIKGAIWCN